MTYNQEEDVSPDMVNRKRVTQRRQSNITSTKLIKRDIYKEKC